MRPDDKLALWGAVHAFQASGDAVYGNTKRQEAVTAVESAVADIDRAARLDELRSMAGVYCGHCLRGEEPDQGRHAIGPGVTKSCPAMPIRDRIAELEKEGGE